MKTRAIGGLFMLATASAAQADYLKGDYSVCVSEQLFDNMMAAVARQDESAIWRLLDYGCAIPVGGVPVSVVRVYASERKAQVIAHTGGVDAEVWTNSSNIVHSK